MHNRVISASSVGPAPKSGDKCNRPGDLRNVLDRFSASAERRLQRSVNRHMMESLLQGNDWRAWLEQTGASGNLGGVAIAPAQAAPLHAEAWEQTDRPLQSPARQHSATPDGDDSTSSVGSVRARWLQAQDIRTEFFDGGIGCCWFAQQGDGEPVCGETEEVAIARLMHKKGLSWPKSRKTVRSSSSRSSR
jgi:hypothetical protein